MEKITGLIDATGQYKVTGIQPTDIQTGSGSEHLIIIGGGSAAFAAAIEARERGAKITMINDGLPIGGTCVNVGCVPSKNLIRTAESLQRARHNPFAGIQTSGALSDFQALVRQKEDLVQSLRQSKYIDILSDDERVTMIEGRARLVSPTRVAVDGNFIDGDKILVTTGARPRIPDIDGLQDVPYFTNEDIFDLDQLLESLIVLGGRFIALETAQLFARLGSRVTLLQRSDRILPDQQPELTDALTKYLTEEGLTIITGNDFQRIRAGEEEVIVESVIAGEKQTFRAEKLLVATGRRPNTDQMGLTEIDVDLKPDGSIVVSDDLQSSMPGIYAAGDVLGEHLFVYTAAYEGQLAARNALSQEKTKRDYRILPWVIFTDPQVAGVGLDMEQAKAQGLNAEAVTLPMEQVPRAIVAHETKGFIELVRDRDTDTLIGARILARDGAELIMEVSLAMKFGITVRELTNMFHPYLTLSEGIKMAAISFSKDVRQLSCCAA